MMNKSNAPSHKELSCSNDPMISVVICTYNRADSLKSTICSVVNQHMAGGDFEVIVVDNGSNDRTRQVVDDFNMSKLMHYVYEETLGLCHARNAGWRRARGKYIAYLDDDAIASPEWLMAIKEAFESSPDAGIVGGCVEPIWEEERPGWLSDDVSLSLTILDWSDTPKIITDLNKEWLVGANMAISASVLAQVGGFHSGLDRTGKHLLSNGDTFLQRQIVQLGYSCVYYPAMKVQHIVPVSRLTKQWFLRRYYWQGVSDAVVCLIEDSPGLYRRLRLAAKAFNSLLRTPRMLQYLIFPTDDPHHFQCKCFKWIVIGHISGMLGAARK